MAEEIQSHEKSEKKLDQHLAEITDYATFNKIINKLTDYAEILTQGKISGIINFNYRLNSVQTNDIIKIMEDMQGLSRIYSLSVKGSRDIEMEYISNIFSNYEGPETISSYVNLKNIIENRLTHQIQQYNIIMGKNNTTLAIPLNELRGHVKTYRDLSGLDYTISPKAQHGIIAASLHDAYATLLVRQDYWNEKSYMKFFFNEDDQSKRRLLLLRKERRLSLREIAFKAKEMLDELHAIQYARMRAFHEPSTADAGPAPPIDYFIRGSKSEAFTDRMMLTPFGKQYGDLIEKIISGIFDPARKASYDDRRETAVKEKISTVFNAYKLKSDMGQHKGIITEIGDYLLLQDFGIKTFAEKLLYADRRETFSKFYTEHTQELVEQFLGQLFNIYFEAGFSSLFRIIKSLDMKKFACAFIIKRIYTREGENLTNFGFFFIRVIARIGGIRSQ